MRERADKVIFRRGLSKSRREAQSFIQEGLVTLRGKPITSPSQKIEEDAKINIAEHPSYVSRGAIKLISALDYFRIDPSGLIALDIGISTGGFSEVLLKRGAARVYGIEVGENQLSPQLKNHSSLIHFEKTNARDLNPRLIPERVDLITCDVSFVSLKQALPAALALAASNATLIALIKPQFEVGREALGKKGIVRDPVLHQKTCREISQWLTNRGWPVLGLIESPILGGSGNKEFLVAARKIS